ncbi:elongation factor G domain protein (macronuclear) [Tetrahymena thermophila SB210]|uniref:116 kDa U5 small nuclear ribonucleoprotein component n=1 Tax=Tetrahymena thermophila (strain SB210) TaxID=312017 RepID=Q23FM4_TETTS|nr:elongation factor G domain protein [Tetrahymena thermophila SB210]EAR95586.1 elongation factor G domain protein [Tetrahymena thermophila SB210]|eukprot:XP_001015831.1 elongation factor G domain protein [Tetrahymena thermophila SB210]
MDDEDLYDEFGNYKGPEIEENYDEDEQYFDRENEEFEEDQNGANVNEEHEEIMERAVVLHEDKQYYPEMSEVYPEAENLVMEEDAQRIEEPIVAPVKEKDFDLVDRGNQETNSTIQFMQQIMKKTELVRNVGIVGHLHHGKTGLMDMFVKQTHVHREWDLEKEYRFTDARKDEQERLLSIKSSPMSLILPDFRDKSYLLNIFDTPGHPNFSDEVCCALRMCDGVVLVVDALDGVMLNTERIIRYCVKEKIAITILINKIDRLIIETKLPPVDAYLKIRHTIDEINDIIASLGRDDFDSLKVSPLLGNVCFGSTAYGFVFSIQSFAEMYSKSYGIQKDFFTKLLWGNYYFNSDTRKFMNKPTKDFNKRCFVEFILEPIYKIFSHVVSKEKDQLKPVLGKLGVYLKNSDYKLDIKPLLKLVFSTFFGNTGALVSMVAQHIPSAKQGTRLKVEQNYVGNRKNPAFEKIKECDPEGPLVINVVKQYNKQDCMSFDVFGRVISGTIRKNQTVKVLGERYNLEDEEDMTVKDVRKLFIFQARYKIEVNEITAGNWVLIEGIDQSIQKSATIISQDDSNKIEIFRPVKHDTTPVIKVAIEPLIPSELPKMLEGLRKVSKSYPLLVTKVEESGEHILIGTGELYIDCVLHDLRRMYSDIEIKVSDPSVSFCETIIDTSSIKCYADTPNKKNRLTMLASQLDKGLAKDIEKEVISLDFEKPIVSKFFQEKYDWDILAARNVWSFGPEKSGANVLIDDTLPNEVDKNILRECKEHINQGFCWATREGPLCDEPVRNVKFKLIEANISSEPLYRAGGQMIPTARRTCYSAFLMAQPRLMEPLLYVEIQCTADAINGCVTVLAKRRGHVEKQIAKAGSPLYTVTAFLPAIDSFGFETDLRIHTCGQAFCVSVFDSWDLLPGDPLDKSIKLNLLEPSPPQDLAREFMIKTRRRKGLNENVSIVKYFDDSALLEALKQDKDYKDYI